MTNTFLMRRFHVFFLILLSTTILFQAGCNGGRTAPKRNFNAYLPPSFEENFANYVPEETPMDAVIKDPQIWDVSDTDISYIATDRPLISFTFDDTPSKNLESILAVFASFNEQNPDYKATASLFINGGLVDEASLHLLHLAHVAGFELGNHTHNHLDLTQLSTEELHAEIEHTDEVLQRVDGKKRHLFRAPFGRTNDVVKTAVKTPIIDWTIDTLDWTGVSAEQIASQVMKEKFSGAIVLMHDGHEATIDALKLLLPSLKAEGYQVVSVSAMAKAHACTLKNGVTYIRARKKRP